MTDNPLIQQKREELYHEYLILAELYSKVPLCGNFLFRQNQPELYEAYTKQNAKVDRLITELRELINGGNKCQTKSDTRELLTGANCSTQLAPDGKSLREHARLMSTPNTRNH